MHRLTYSHRQALNGPAFPARSDIFEDEVERHKLICPAYCMLAAQRAAPYFREDVSAGPPLCASDDPYAGVRALPASAPLAARRVELARQLGPAGLRALVSRISALARTLPPPVTHVLNQEEAVRPPAVAGSVPPYSAKHAAQQASIVGNLGRVRLLERAARDAFVELGAGRGYLGAALSRHCPDLKTLVLVDCRGFKLKADRWAGGGKGLLLRFEETQDGGAAKGGMMI